MVLEYLPGTHTLQADFPAKILYFPASHPSHCPPSAPVNPASHTQSVCSSLPSAELDWAKHGWHTSETAATAVENCPMPQFMHALASIAVWNVPAAHAVHSRPPSPKKPALHTQSVFFVLASAALELGRQD